MTRTLPLLFLFTLSAQAQVSDPSGILDTSDRHLGSVPFEQAFAIGSEIHFTFRGCSILGCPKPRVSRAVVEHATDGQTVVNQYDADGKHYSSEPITASDWDAGHRNFLRIRVNQAASFGFEIEMQSLEEVSCAANSKCLRVKFSGKNAVGMIEQYDYVIQKTVHGLRQVVSYTQTQDRPFKNKNEYFLQ